MKKQYFRVLRYVFVTQLIIGIIFSMVYFAIALFLSILLTYYPKFSFLSETIVVVLPIGNSIITMLVFRFVISRLLDDTDLTLKQFVSICSVYFAVLSMICVLCFVFQLYFLDPILSVFQSGSIIFANVLAIFLDISVNSIVVIATLTENILKVVALGIGYSHALDEVAYKKRIEAKEEVQIDEQSEDVSSASDD